MGQLYSVLTRCIVLCVIFLSLSLMGFANQGKIKVTLEVTNKRRADVLHLLEKQTGMIFFYASNLFNTEQKISVSAVDKALDDVLDKVFEGTGMGWNYEREKFISIKPKKKIVADEPNVDDSSITSIAISGKVISTDGTPIPGATVIIKGTSIGVSTDDNGNFRISGVNKNQTILIRNLGYDTRELPVTKGPILIKLNVSVQSLDETVIKGYYTTTKKFNTGNVGIVKADDIEKQPVSDPMAALIGRVPGLQVTQLSGAPGRAFNIQIRGRNSIDNGSSPLFIVDGVPFFNNVNNSSSVSTTSIDVTGLALGTSMNTSPLNSINPGDIESIEILKDADATAIYGSRGANGVILITTKKGVTGRTEVSANIYHSFGASTRKMQLLKTSDYLAIRKEAYKNDNMSNYPANAYDINGKWDTTKYTDWQKIFLGGISHTTKAEMSISGGNQQTHIHLGMGYQKESTIFPGDYGNRRGSVNFNINHTNATGRFKANLSGMYSYSQNELPLNGFVSSILIAPNAPKLYNDDGSLNWENGTWTNPMNATFQKNISKIKYLNSNLGLSYNLLPGLILKSDFGYTTTDVNQLEITSSKFFNPTSPAGQSYSVFGTNDISIWNFEPQLQYTTSWDKIGIDFLVGTSFMQQLQQGKSFKGTGYTSDELLNSLQSASTISVQGDTYNMYKYNAIFSRLSFNIDKKYILNLTARRDGSSRFGPGRQFANFGAVGAAWIFSDYGYFQKNLQFISFGKLRGSYGITGNDQIGDYQFLDTYQPYYSDYSYLGIVGLQPSRLLNANYAWEVNRKLEGAIELGFFQNRILLDVSYYRNRSSNQLLVQPIAAQTGFGTVVANLPAVVQNTGWEFQFNSVNIKGRSFKWQSSLNITVPKNKLISFPGIENTSYANGFIVGAPLNIVKKLSYINVDEQTGLYTFVDWDKDGKIAFPGDYQKVIFTGQQYYGGLLNEFQLQNFLFSFLFQFVRQKTIPNYSTILTRPGTIGNQPSYILDRWTESGESTSVQKISNSSDASTSYSNFRQSDGAYSDGSFIRLKNVSLSYTFDLSRKGPLNRLKVYANAQNLLTFTNYKGLDPESRTFLPPLRIVSAGIQIVL